MKGIEPLLDPLKVWSREEVLARPSPVPAKPGIYVWYFRALPDARIDTSRCVFYDGMPLLYIGIAPKKPPALGNPSKQSLRSRIRYHYRGNAYGSTLRLTLGCLLAESLGIQLRRVGSGTRLTFTPAGELVLSTWMGENALVTWLETDDPWLLEDEALGQLDLPLNLQGNRMHPFHSELTRIRATAKALARSHPIAMS